MSFKPVVQTDNSGKWYDNALRFETYDEALHNAHDLAQRWFAVLEFGVEESPDPVNYSYANRVLQPVIGIVKREDDQPPSAA